jgi:hypothetical protein
MALDYRLLVEAEIRPCAGFSGLYIGSGQRLRLATGQIYGGTEFIEAAYVGVLKGKQVSVARLCSCRSRFGEMAMDVTTGSN